MRDNSIIVGKRPAPQPEKPKKNSKEVRRYSCYIPGNVDCIKCQPGRENEINFEKEKILLEEKILYFLIAFICAPIMLLGIFASFFNNAFKTGKEHGDRVWRDLMLKEKENGSNK